MLDPRCTPIFHACSQSNLAPFLSLAFRAAWCFVLHLRSIATVLLSPFPVLRSLRSPLSNRRAQNDEARSSAERASRQTSMLAPSRAAPERPPTAESHARVLQRGRGRSRRACLELPAETRFADWWIGFGCGDRRSMSSSRAQLSESLLSPQAPRSLLVGRSPDPSDLDLDDSPPTIVRIEAAPSSSSARTRPPKKTPYCLEARIYIVLLLLESFVLIGTAVCALISVYTWERPPDDDGRSVSLSVVNTALVAITATCGMLYFGLDALRLQHRFQLFAAIGAHTSIVFFVFIHWRSSDLGVWFRRVSGGTLVMVCVCEVAYIGLSVPVLKSFGRRMFDRLRSSSVAMSAMYQTAAIYFSLLKIDCYLQLLLVRRKHTDRDRARGRLYFSPSFLLPCAVSLPCLLLFR